MSWTLDDVRPVTSDALFSHPHTGFTFAQSDFGHNGSDFEMGADLDFSWDHEGTFHVPDGIFLQYRVERLDTETNVNSPLGGYSACWTSASSTVSNADGSGSCTGLRIHIRPDDFDVPQTIRLRIDIKGQFDPSDPPRTSFYVTLVYVPNMPGGPGGTGGWHPTTTTPPTRETDRILLAVIEGDSDLLAPALSIDALPGLSMQAGGTLWRRIDFDF